MKARLRWDGTERVCRERERAVGKTRERQGHEEKIGLWRVGGTVTPSPRTKEQAKERKNERPDSETIRGLRTVQRGKKMI